MVLMNTLRMLVDVSFFGAFGGLIAGACGGSGAIWGMLIQCLCFGLSRLGGNKRGVRMIFLLPVLLGWVIYRDVPADCVLLVPTAVYIVWLVWRKDYALDCERQRYLFGVFWKVLLAVVALGIMLGVFDVITAITVPYALIVLLCSVLLMRALRHEPKVYCGVRYQITNLSAVAAVAAVAGLLSAKAVLTGCAAVLKTIYGALIRPVLECLLHILLCVIGWIVALVSRLASGDGKSDEREAVQMDLSGAEEIFGENVVLKEPGELVRTLGTVLLVLIAVTALVLLFRWISRHRGTQSGAPECAERRESVEVVRHTVKKKESSPVRRIRAQYRVFLNWCAGTGVRIEQSSTSLDVHRQVDRLSGHGRISEQIRELYLKARYARIADPSDVRRMKQLCDQIKKSDEKVQ